MTAPVLPSLSRMHAGDHYCGIYRTDEDHRRIVVDFVREGISRGEKMLYLVNIHTAAHLETMLRDAGIDPEPLRASGQLTIQSAKEAYLKDGEFVPEKMIELLKEATQQALDEGYPALRTTGEMTWALMGEPGSERLVEYEALLNNFRTRSLSSSPSVTRPPTRSSEWISLMSAKSSAPISSPPPSITVRSIRFRNSRRLPGQLYDRIVVRASSENPRNCFPAL